jgi:paraquat-inducible protein B
MSKKASPTAVGGFTLGALIVLVGIILTFGSEHFMRHAADCVLYFDESVEGLDVGAPVLFRGVQIGAVKGLKLVYDVQRDDFRIPVVIELYKDSAIQVNGEPIMHTERLDELVARGARAQLNAQSLLTGKLNVTIDFRPETEVRIVPDHTGLPQIPTVPRPLTTFSRKLAELPLNDLIRDLSSAIRGLSELVGTPAAGDVVENLNATLESLQRLLASAESQVAPLARDLTETADAAERSLTAASSALARIEASMNRESPVGFEISRLIDAMTDAARNIAALTAALERQPEAVLKGKTQKERY